MWNYRVVRNKSPKSHDYLAIHEVYYGTDGSTPVMVTKVPVGVGADAGNDQASIDEIRQALHLMLGAIEKPILDFDHIPPKEKKKR